MGKQETLETIWEVPDELGTDRTYHPGGRPAQSPGPQALTHDRCSTASSSGCAAGANGTIAERAWGRQHHSSTFQRWVGMGVLHRMWGALVEGCEELDGVDWEWQAADGAMGKARFGGT